MKHLFADSTPYLVVVRNASIIGVLPDQTDVFKVNRVALLPLTTQEPAVSLGELDVSITTSYHWTHFVGAL